MFEFRALKRVSVWRGADQLKRAERAPCSTGLLRLHPCSGVSSHCHTQTHTHTSKHGQHTGRCAHAGGSTQRPRHTYKHTRPHGHVCACLHTQPRAPMLRGTQATSASSVDTLHDPGGAIPTEHRASRRCGMLRHGGPGAPFPNGVTVEANFSFQISCLCQGREWT